MYHKLGLMPIHGDSECCVNYFNLFSDDEINIPTRLLVSEIAQDYPMKKKRDLPIVTTCKCDGLFGKG